MMKLFKPQRIILTLLILGQVHLSYSQDTATKKAPVKQAAAKQIPNKPATVIKTTGQPAPATPTVYRQPAAPAAPVDKSLRGQYQYLLTKVYNYQQPLVSALFKNYSDTLSITRKQLKEAKATLASQTKTIDTLKASASSKEQNLTQAQAKVNEISLLGIAMPKATYNLIMWGLVIGFGIIAAIVIARSGSHSREARYRIKLYNELEEEYKNYKTKANEKEKKLARELQTERNKLEELRGNG